MAGSEWAVWVPSAEPEPPWSDAVHGGQVGLPTTERAAGHAGWYDLATWADRNPDASSDTDPATTTTVVTDPTTTTTIGAWPSPSGDG